MLQQTALLAGSGQNFAHRTEAEDSALPKFSADLQRHNRHNCCGLPVAVVLLSPWRGDIAVPHSPASELFAN